MKIVVIGNAKTGLAFVGPFNAPADADAWITAWQAKPNRDQVPIGPVDLTEPADQTAGALFNNTSGN